jgi:glycosyltransferase involved in cell wall biosynthesis
MPGEDVKVSQQRDGRALKVAMIMTNLDDLGVQRVVINLYNHFDRERVDPSLVVWQNSGKVAHFLKTEKPVIETDVGLRRPRLVFRLFRYRRILKELRPDVILSFVPVTNLSMAVIGMLSPKSVPIVMCEHAFISRAFANGEYYGAFRPLYRCMMRPMYNSIAAKLIMTAVAGKTDAVDNWRIRKEKIEIIHNPQDISELQRRAAELPDHEWLRNKTVPVIIGAGRLTRQKGFDKLLAAFTLVSNRRDARLLILGRGELEGDLRAIANESGISDRVQFLGFQTNHLQYISRADVFVLSSIWEAMPMVIAETMAVGTPIVSFDCPSGPREMLDGGECGFLVPDQDIGLLAEGVEYALDHQEESKKRALKARRKVEQFDVHLVARKYESVLQSAAGLK